MICDESERSPERSERADADADDPKPRAVGPLLLLCDVKTDRMEDVIEGALGARRGVV